MFDVGAAVDGDGGDAGADVVVTAVTGMAGSGAVEDMGTQTDTAVFRFGNDHSMVALDQAHLSC